MLHLLYYYQWLSWKLFTSGYVTHCWRLYIETVYYLLTCQQIYCVEYIRGTFCTSWTCRCTEGVHQSFEDFQNVNLMSINFHNPLSPEHIYLLNHVYCIPVSYLFCKYIMFYHEVFHIILVWTCCIALTYIP